MPSDHDITTCPSCSQPIRWAITAKGKRMPVDAKPDPQGNLGCRTDHTGTLHSRSLSGDRARLEHEEWQAMPHFATCTAPPRRRTGPPRRSTAVRPAPWQR